MIINSPVISRLAEVCELVTPQPNDSDITVPNVIVPALELPEPQSGYPVPVAGSIALPLARTSVAGSLVTTRAAGLGAQTTRFLFLGSGVWRIYVSYSAAVPAIVTAWALTYATVLVSGTNQFFQIAQFFGANAIRHDHSQQDFLVSIPRGGSGILDLTLDNTGGATTMAAHVGVLANKILG